MAKKQADSPGGKGASYAVEMVAMEHLSEDPANARKHGEKNVDAIVASLRRFGQQKPIVIDQNNVVRAGNGTLQAARVLGWQEIAAYRSTLTGAEMAAYAIADNRTAELAEWDEEILRATLEGLAVDDAELLEAAGYDESELEELIGEGGESTELKATKLEQAIQLVPDREYIVVMCRDEIEWEEMKARLKLSPVRRGGYKEGSAFDSTGTQRVIKWKTLKEAVSDICDTI